MIEDQIKFICKWTVENSNRPLNRLEKEAIKQAIDSAKTVEELASVVIATMMAN